PGPTDASGSTSGTLASTVAEIKTVTATAGANDIALAAQATVEFIADAGTVSATLSSAGALPASGLVANGFDIATVTIVVRDAQGNPVAGQSIALVSDDPSDVLVQPGPTDAT